MRHVLRAAGRTAGSPRLWTVMPRRAPAPTVAPRPQTGRRRRGLAILLALVAGPGVPAAAAVRAGADWRLPVDGVIVGGFRVTPQAPFAAGQRRGIDLLARPGRAVRAPCGGAVRHAGPLPGRARGLGVTVRCRPGPYVATVLGLARLTVRRGAAVAPGQRLGTAGPRGRIRLGARRDGDRFGYVDPRGLLGVTSRTPPAPRPGPIAPRASAPPPRPRALPRPLSYRPPARDGDPAPAVPAAAWAGLALVAAGTPLTVAGIRRRSRARRRRAATTGPRAAHR